MAADILQMTSDRNTPIDNSTGSPVALKNQNKDDDMCGHVTNINKEQDMDSRSEQSKEIENNNSSLDLSLDDSDSGKMGNGILSQFSNYSEKDTCNNDNSDIDDDGLVDNDDNVSNGSEIGMAKSPVSSTAQISDRNSYDIKSQYHSIQQLSLPAVGHTANPASFGQAFNTPNLPISSAYDFSFASLYEKNRRNNLDSKQGILGGDSVYFLRNLINSNHSNVFDGYNNDISRQDQGSPLALCNNRHRDTKAERKMEEDDQDKPVDMTGFFGSQKESYEDSLLRTPSNLSVSSRADLSDDEDDGCDVLRQNKRRRFDKEMDDGSDLDVESFIQDDSASMSDDQGSCDDIVEAKRARMEAIVNNMRVSPNERSISNNAAVKTEMMDGSRRARRKQQAPRQHDISSSSLDMDNVGDGSEVSDKGDLQQELRYVRDQLAEMESKYCQLLEKSDKKENKDQSILDCRRIVADQKKDLSHFVQESARDLVNRQLSQRWLALMGDINCNGKSFEKSNPSIGDASLDVQNLAEMLRSEITSSVGSLVDEIVKNFVKKHKLEKEGIKEEQNSSPRRRLSSDGGDSSEDDLNESKEFCNKPASHIKEEEKVTRNFPCKSQIPSSMFLPQTFPPSMAQILAGFSEYSMMNRFGYLQKNLGKPVERFPPYLDQQIQKSSFNLPRPGGVPLFPSNPFFPGAGLTTPTAPSLFQREPEQTEALPLVVNSAPAKKKRTKVTDTRLSPRAARAMLQESNPAHPGRQDHLEPTPGDQAMNDPSILTSNDFSVHNRHLQGHYSSQTPQSLLPASLPTSVAVPNPSLQHSDILQAIYSRHHLQSRPQQLDFTPKHPQDTLGKTSSRSSTPGEVASLSGGERGKKFGGGVESYRTRDQLIGAEFSSDLTSYDEHALTSTLTPVHLRKAKLMFFYVRYPSSSVIKTFFPDVKFNKNNTAQLIKWFSNFREFYYIQMEKYARQAISDGTKSSSEIIVTLDSEIYRVLVLHYNRNNQIEVPDNFRTTVQATLREFFKSIQAERDQEPSWKKAIYKIIARLDDNVPEYFKSTNWMEQLIDG